MPRSSLRARLRPGFRLGESSSSERRAHAPEGGPTGPEAGRTVLPNVLSEVEGRAQHEREDLQCLYNYGPINN